MPQTHLQWQIYKEGRGSYLGFSGKSMEGLYLKKQVYHKKIIFQQIEELCKLFLQQMVFLIHFYRLKFVQPIN